MIELYTWSTPNGRKVSILLEELGMPYRVHPIDITKGEQFAPDFLRIGPNNRIPAIVDTDTGLHLMESGAIMIYLADKAGRFLAAGGAARHHTIEWLMWQMGGFGPMLGQAHHFLHYNPGKSAYAEERYTKETQRLYGVLERRLEGREYVVEDYSIADMAIWPWVSRYGYHRIDLADYPSVKRWYLDLAKRPGVVRGFGVPDHGDTVPLP